MNNHYTKTIQLHDLLKRWNGKKLVIEELCFAGWLIPHHELGCGSACRFKSKRAFVFCKLPISENDIPTNAQQSWVFYSLPDDVFFYMTDINAFEDKHPELSVYE